MTKPLFSSVLQAQRARARLKILPHARLFDSLRSSLHPPTLLALCRRSFVKSQPTTAPSNTLSLAPDTEILSSTASHVSRHFKPSESLSQPFTELSFWANTNLVWFQ